MARSRTLGFVVRLAAAAAIGGIVGGFLRLASAQDRTAGVLDEKCAVECSEHGYDPEFCGRVCWIPDPAMAARGSSIDWTCMNDCKATDVREEDCRQRCKRR